MQESHAVGPRATGKWLTRVTDEDVGDEQGEDEEGDEELHDDAVDAGGGGVGEEGGALYNADTGRFYTKSTASSVSEASSVDDDEGEAGGTADVHDMHRTESGRSDVSALTDFSEGDGPYYAIGDRVLALFDDDVNLYPGTIEEVYESQLGFAYSVVYDDGDHRQDVPEADIEHLVPVPVVGPEGGDGGRDIDGSHAGEAGHPAAPEGAGGGGGGGGVVEPDGGSNFHETMMSELSEMAVASPASSPESQRGKARAFDLESFELEALALEGRVRSTSAGSNRALQFKISVWR